MKLDRNLNADGRGKYGLIKNRRIAELTNHNGSGAAANRLYAMLEALDTLERLGVIDWGDTIDTEFFLIRLRDKNAGHALAHYAAKARDDDPEYSMEVSGLALRAGGNHPHCKVPD